MSTDPGTINFDSNDPDDKITAILAELGIDQSEVDVVVAEENTPEGDALSEVIFMEQVNEALELITDMECPEHRFAEALSLLFTLKERQDQRHPVSTHKRIARAAIMSVACNLFNLYGRL